MRSDSIASLPIPGQANIVSVTTEPETRSPNVMPPNVRDGIMALRKACFHMTLCEASPLARANLIYSESKTSNMADLISRMLTAAKNQPRVIVGRIMLVAPARPEGGNHSNLTEKRKMSIIPSQKVGMACPDIARTLPTESRRDPRLVAERTPKGTPVTTENKNAAAASRRVLGSLSKIMPLTGRRSRIDVPISPRTASLTNIQYWA